MYIDGYMFRFLDETSRAFLPARRIQGNGIRRINFARLEVPAQRNIGYYTGRNGRATYGRSILCWDGPVDVNLDAGISRAIRCRLCR